MFFQVVDNADELIIIFACNHLNRLILHVQVGHFLWNFVALGVWAHNLLPFGLLLGRRIAQRWLTELRMHCAWLVHFCLPPVQDVVAILTGHAWKLHILGREVPPQLIATLLLAPVLRAQNSLDVLDFYILRDLLWLGLLVFVVVDIQCWARQRVDKAGRSTLLARVLHEHTARLLRGSCFLLQGLGRGWVYSFDFTVRMLHSEVRVFPFDLLISAMRSLHLYQAMSTAVMVPGINIRRRLGEVVHLIDLWHFVNFVYVHETAL